MARPTLLFIVIINMVFLNFAIETSQTSVEVVGNSGVAYEQDGSKRAGQGQGTGQGQGGKGKQKQKEDFEPCNTDEDCYREEGCDKSECKKALCLCYVKKTIEKPTGCYPSKKNCNSNCEDKFFSTIGGDICKQTKKSSTQVADKEVNRCFCSYKE